MAETELLCTSEECILSCQFSPFPATGPLLAYGTETLLVIGSVHLTTKTFEKLRTFQHGASVFAIAWSPLSQLKQ